LHDCESLGGVNRSYKFRLWSLC